MHDQHPRVGLWLVEPRAQLDRRRAAEGVGVRFRAEMPTLGATGRDFLTPGGLTSGASSGATQLKFKLDHPTGAVHHEASAGGQFGVGCEP